MKAHSRRLVVALRAVCSPLPAGFPNHATWRTGRSKSTDAVDGSTMVVSSVVVNGSVALLNRTFEFCLGSERVT
jgi:hypothetical protein